MCVFLTATLALLLWVPIKTALDVAAVQNAVQRDWEISFWSPSAPSIKPAVLPASLNAEANDFFARIFASTRGYDGSQPTKTRNRDIVARERFHALFRGSIQDVHIYYFEAFRGDLGAALARFPDLRRVTVIDNEQDLPTESEWTLLCTRLRTIPHLEEIEIGGAWVTDAAIAPLAGHPALHTLSISFGRLTASCATTFTSLPRLSKLNIGEQIHDGDDWLSPASQAAMSATLPQVSIDFPRP
jgi:hypothetical protein